MSRILRILYSSVRSNKLKKPQTISSISIAGWMKRRLTGTPIGPMALLWPYYGPMIRMEGSTMVSFPHFSNEPSVAKDLVYGHGKKIMEGHVAFESGIVSRQWNHMEPLELAMVLFSIILPRSSV